MSIAQKIMSGVPSGPEGAWDLSFAYYDDPFAWDISTEKLLASRSVSSEISGTPYSLFFKPDGTKMYIADTSSADISEYDLSTAWSVNSETYVQSFSVSSEETSPRAVTFKPDGTKMYVTGFGSQDIHEYDLSTAWDISTASLNQSFVGFSGYYGLVFRDDGLKLYGCVGEVYEYDLSTAWDISTATLNQNTNLPLSTSTGLHFKPEGDAFFLVDGGTGDVSKYDLSTAWDVSTASFDQTVDLSSEETTGYALFFKPDGLKMYFSGFNSKAVHEYTLGGFDVSGQETTPTGLFFKPDGLKMYVLGDAGNDVNEYDLSTAWDVSTASYSQNYSVSARESNPTGIFFKPDGLKMYIVGYNGVEVNEFSLSTAWDISTATYVQLFSVSAQETFPYDLFFKPDGLKMYVVGAVGDDVNEYDLSTAWDISTASYLQNFSVASEVLSPRALFFKPDGLKMYIQDQSGDDVNEYDLSTAWDVSTASYLQNFSVAAQDIGPTGLFFKDDGTKMYVVGSVSDAVYSYTLGPQD